MKNPPVWRGPLAAVLITRSAEEGARNPQSVFAFDEFQDPLVVEVHAVEVGQVIGDGHDAATARGCDRRQLLVNVARHRREVMRRVRSTRTSPASESIMRDSGARSFERLYFAGGPDTPEEFQMMRLANELRQRRQERKQRHFGWPFHTPLMDAFQFIACPFFTRYSCVVSVFAAGSRLPKARRPLQWRRSSAALPEGCGTVNG
jgi:hypothetical protein